jgi:cation:H+ antiporter
MIHQVGLAVIELGAGLAVLLYGGSLLVRGATAVALLARVSTAVVALTVVAMGTSLPELAVSLRAAWRGSTDIAYANVVGSSIFNIGAILGIAAVMMAIPVAKHTLKVEYWIVLAATGLALFFAFDGEVEHWEGIALCAGLLAFVLYTIYHARRGVSTTEAAHMDREVRRAAHLEEGVARAWRKHVSFIMLGLIAVAIGAELSVLGAVTGARVLGIEERVIGLTIVAMGTSLPELATCVAAARHNEPDIALGNVLGSNIFNLFGILGVTAAIFPVPVPEVSLSVDNWVLLGFTVVLLPIMWSRWKVSGREGVFLLVGFSVYLAWVLVTG